ncbi:hypothetical protein RHGRI_024279 [Rhododendron griersonianum]|uniref:Kelch repeat-containing protein n=1 Tax=Rhododendron griersonianum TaxID=479676 RepID=A0AAV6JAF6_9ERIC|nr:hypothetical protein RHGRI_024279 [Rhododendron griersonianum]
MDSASKRGESRIAREKKNKSGRGKMKRAGDGNGGDRAVSGKRSKPSRDSQEEEDSAVAVAAEVEKRPCLLGYSGAAEGPVVYRFKLNENRQGKRRNPGKQRGMRVLTPPKSRWKPACSMTVVVGTTVYALGGLPAHTDAEGRHILSHEVFYFDTSRRSEAGKIYVFGGFDWCYDEDVEDDKNNNFNGPWAEVLDTARYNSKWEPLPPPPEIDNILHGGQDNIIGSPIAVYGGPSEPKILLAWCDCVYHVNSGTWEEFRGLPCPRNSQSTPPELTGNLIAVGNSLYWTTRGVLQTFDMSTGEFDGASVEGFSTSKYRDLMPPPEPGLLHLGGDSFCFLTLKELGPDPPSKIRFLGRTMYRILAFRDPNHPGDCGTKIRFSKFRVGREERGDVIEIVIFANFVLAVE